MKKVTYFIANDGTMFDSYYACVTYEKTENVKAAQGQLRFYDYRGELIADHNITEEEAPERLKDCYYLFLGNEAAIRVADEMGYIANCSTPKTTGYWYYNSKENLWTSFDTRMIVLKSELDMLENTLKKLEGN